MGLVHVALRELGVAPAGPVPNQLMAAGARDPLDEHDVGGMLEDRAVALAQDVPQVLGGGSPGGIVLAHVAEPTSELGDPLAVAGFALPLDRQVRRLEELGPGDQGDAGRAKDFHDGLVCEL